MNEVGSKLESQIIQDLCLKNCEQLSGKILSREWHKCITYFESQLGTKSRWSLTFKDMEKLNEDIL